MLALRHSTALCIQRSTTSLSLCIELMLSSWGLCLCFYSHCCAVIMPCRTFKRALLAFRTISPAFLAYALSNSHPRSVPADGSYLTPITLQTEVQIRYREPGKGGVCDTTSGVNSYFVCIDLSPTSHTLFWFFEA